MAAFVRSMITHFSEKCPPILPLERFYSVQKHLKAVVSGHKYKLSPHFLPPTGNKHNQTSTKLHKEPENTAVQDHVKPVY